MSWFGETFGDSFNSLKGQITKITKEVLADDEVASSEAKEPEIPITKVRESLCHSKDIEIAALKDELNKLHSFYKTQLEFSKSENVTKGNKSDDGSEIQKLKSELIEVRNERDHLNSCLEELQLEHQTNLKQVISLKDQYKHELEVLKKEYNLAKAKLNNISNTEAVNGNRDNEISLLNSKIHELEALLHNEKESQIVFRQETENQNDLKDQVKKLLGDIQVICLDKEKIEQNQKTFQNENIELKTKVIELEKENKENEIQLKLLLNEKKELLKDCQDKEVESKLSVLMETETQVQQKLKNIMQMLNISINDIKYENNVIKLLNLIEVKLDQQCKELSDNLKQLKNNLEIEVKKLTEENTNFQNKLKIINDNKTEMERKYQEEISLLRSTLSEMKAQEQDCINQSQTDDVKRLEQEMAHCTSLLLCKNSELADYSNMLKNLQEELTDLKASSLNIEEELLATKTEKAKLEDEIVNLKNFSDRGSQDNLKLQEKLKVLESESVSLGLQNKMLQSKISQLEEESNKILSGNEKLEKLQSELEKAEISKSETHRMLEELQSENFKLKNEFENLKTEIVFREARLAELMKTNTFFQEEMNKLQAQNNELMNVDKEMKKWKDTSVDLQIQLEDCIVKKEELENECLKLKNELEKGLALKESEIEQLRLANSNLMKSYEYESKTVTESFLKENHELKERYQKQEELISRLQEENTELKSRIQRFQEQMKIQLQSQPVLKNNAQLHRRSKSDVDTESLDVPKSGVSIPEDLGLLKQALQQEQAKYQILYNQFQEISSKEASARKEFERLKQHLIEVEGHYTEEAVENEKIINDLKLKLMASEEQLQNSSTLYTSLKVRDNQHLESLQSQIRMVSAQRDDFQTKLSAAEDEVQKHKASLMSLQIVLEQFQQDKEREVQRVVMEYEKKLASDNSHVRDLETEIQSLRNQLNEAKNGLKAASRLGEQLERKTQQVSQLEENLSVINRRVAELESSLASVNQANSGKVDKLLVKNLVIGYVLSANTDRKSQVLRIMASVLDFDQDEKTKMGVDANRSNWLSNILHPKGDSPPNSQSLSEAFIRFLENESRPTPQLRLLPEQYEASVSKSSSAPKPPPGHLSELMLPTFNSSQENESSIILKNVLKDS